MKREGHRDEDIHFVGNVMIDTLLHQVGQHYDHGMSKVFSWRRGCGRERSCMTKDELLFRHVTVESHLRGALKV